MYNVYHNQNLLFVARNFGPRLVSIFTKNTFPCLGSKNSLLLEMMVDGS